MKQEELQYWYVARASGERSGERRVRFLPSPLPISETGKFRITPRVFHRMIQIISIPDEMIVALRLPESSASIQDRVRCLCRERFPRSKNGCERMTCYWLHNHMNMIGHDAPSEECVVLVFKEAQCICDDFCNALIFEPAGSISVPEESFNGFSL